LGLFDAVAMNPPFHVRADIRHIEHARQFLKPGGVLAAICMDTRHRREAFQAVASDWRELPAGSFKDAATGVAAIMFTIRN
jgi:16S rRNA G1207 methylase RsmC